ncbi:MAG: hypothetical protein ACI9LM_004597 [Alteromonadaceae bacterium]|jgi:hypothetical protein
MSDYFIQSTKNIVRVNRIINGELEAIKINGDLQIPLSEFWPLFKQKIEYEADETLAFIVFTDNETFEMDSEIIIAEKFISTETVLNTFIFEHLTENIHLFTHPTFDVTINKTTPRSSINVQTSEPDLVQEIEGDSLQSFFRKKTREIQRENNKVTGGK